VLTLLFAYGVAALGMLTGMFFRTRERSMQLLVATSLPVMFLSGLTWPASAIPLPLRSLGALLPSTAAIQGFVATNQMGASLYEVRMELAVLLGLALMFIVVGLAKWGRMPAPR